MEQIPEHSTRTKCKYSAAALAERTSHLCVHTDTALSGHCSLSASLIKVPKLWLVTGWVSADSLPGQDIVHIGSYLLCYQEKTEHSMLCAKATQPGRIYLQFLGGARSPPNNFPSTPWKPVGSTGAFPSAQHRLEEDEVAEMETKGKSFN